MNWFGPPWWSYVCYDEEGRLNEENRIPPPPPGTACLWCEEQFTRDDSGVQMPLGLADGSWDVTHIHKECQLRSVLGCVAHLEGRCLCNGGGDYEDPALTKRQDALAAWNWVHVHGGAS